MKRKNHVKSLFGTNLKKYRELANLSQTELAEKVSCNPKYLSEIETGKSFASSELIEDLVSVLHVPVSYLFESPDDNPEESAVIEKAIDKIVLEMSDKMKDILSSR
jgi:transcriptional regulator with XRE-family HTH domain